MSEYVIGGGNDFVNVFPHLKNTEKVWNLMALQKKNGQNGLALIIQLKKWMQQQKVKSDGVPFVCLCEW